MTQYIISYSTPDRIEFLGYYEGENLSEAAQDALDTVEDSLKGSIVEAGKLTCSEVSQEFHIFIRASLKVTSIS